MYSYAPLHKLCITCFFLFWKFIELIEICPCLLKHVDHHQKIGCCTRPTYAWKMRPLQYTQSSHVVWDSSCGLGPFAGRQAMARGGNKRHAGQRRYLCQGFQLHHDRGTRRQWNLKWCLLRPCTAWWQGHLPSSWKSTLNPESRWWNHPWNSKSRRGSEWNWRSNQSFHRRPSSGHE